MPLQLSAVRNAVFRLRPEEVAAVVFLIPTSWFTVIADRYVRDHALSRGQYPAAVSRLGFAIALLLLLALLVRHFPTSRLVVLARECVPFVTCVLIYTNLHDTLGFARSADIHPALAGFDQWLFGVQPTVWVEAFVTPERTELMNLLYWSFTWIAVGPPVTLLLLGRLRAVRTSTLGIVTCFFLGYALYVIFPARPPWLALADRYSVSLDGYALTRLARGAMELLPVDSRAAFPSLHAAVSLLSLYYSARFLKPLAVVLLPLVAGLLVSTVYLRHHFVADLLAGAALAPIAAALAPRLDRAWARRQRRLGFQPALGVEPDQPDLARESDEWPGGAPLETRP